ncbi:hypothetical protein [Tissierella sp.]|uniref:hypothetical protein n=1 Tax=Tissierella sp. TaxID=41274 RepID=UPI00285F2220|nr:hypothetical protein [Tissierella sp.]MDR7856339.1 hypothetical protein [Tissierella sp.]
MLNPLIKIIEKIVSTGVDGTILILPLIVLFWILVGQGKDCIGVAKKVLRNEAREVRNR